MNNTIENVCKFLPTEYNKDVSLYVDACTPYHAKALHSH